MCPQTSHEEHFDVACAGWGHFPVGGGGGVGGAPVYLVWPQTSHGECFEVAGVSWRDFPGIPRQYISRL